MKSDILKIWNIYILSIFIFQNTFKCQNTSKLETIFFRIDNGCEIWKIYIHSFQIISLLLRIVNEHDESPSLPRSAHSPSVMDCNEGRSIQINSFKFILYFPLLLMRNHGMNNHPMTWIVDLEDLFITIFNISSIPPITNELE